MYFARSENEKGEKETVQHHLQRCAKLARQFADSFGCGDEGEIEGLFHDFGKYSRLFQEVLDGKRNRVNHEAAGAVIIKNLYPNKGSILARTIFGHHKGLKFNIDNLLRKSLEHGSTDIENRNYAISGAEEYNKSFSIFQSEIRIPEITIKPVYYIYCKNKKIDEMLYTRFLFSCLVDADYSSSAEHFDTDYLKKTTGSELDCQQIINTLTVYRDELKSKSTSDIGINKIRDELFNNCIFAAGKLPGLFTLTAPTGTGKTLSLFAFALEHAKQFHKTRIILVLPFLSIIDQNAHTYKKLCDDILEDHSQSEYDEESRYFSERWSSPVIITTSVKFFEALFTYKPTDCRKLHSIANSVIVFDEAQSLPPHLIGATLDSINALCGRFKCSVVFSTATQPSFEYRTDIDWKPVKIVDDPQDLFNHTRRVKTEWRVKGQMKTPLSSIAEGMSKIDSCCTIVNMKKHAVKLFKYLQDILGTDDESVFHISTDMCVFHRINTLNMIKLRLEHNLPCRIVSTQCIEAGVDLDVKVLYRALAPLDAIIQSAGRCNRNGIYKEGKVIVFIPDEEHLYPGDYYKLAANKVLILLSEHDIDINDLEHIKEYYQLLYEDNVQDEKKLRDAIESMDFEEVYKNYKLIDNHTINVIVPYKEEKALYSDIKNEVIMNGISPTIMRQARGITVSSYNRVAVEKTCERLYYCAAYGGKKTESNWYLLNDVNLYNDKIGLYLTSETELNTAI